MPFELVTAVAVAEPENAAPAPLPGAVKVTVAPPTGLAYESLTDTCREVENAVLTVVLCGVPALAVTIAATPALLVSEKLAGVEAPTAVAVTV
jgi:hypothetical protein